MLFPQNPAAPSESDRILFLINATCDVGSKNAAQGWRILYDGKTASEVQETYTALGSKGGAVNMANAVLGVALNVITRKLNGETLSANELAFLATVEPLVSELDAKPVKLVPPFPITTDENGNVTVQV